MTLYLPSRHDGYDSPTVPGASILRNVVCSCTVWMGNFVLPLRETDVCWCCSSMGCRRRHCGLRWTRLHGSGENYMTRIFRCRGLLKIIVGVQLSSGNSAPNSRNNRHLSIAFESGIHSFKRQGTCVSRNWRCRQFRTSSIIVLMFVESQRVHI